MIEGGFLLSVDKVVKIGKLFSFYSKLLTEKQRKVVRLYYYHDLSLGEIAAEEGISRQAVYDNLKRSEIALQEYENKLKLMKYYDDIQEEIDGLEEVLNKVDVKLDEEEIDEFKDIIARLRAYQEGELE